MNDSNTNVRLSPKMAIVIYTDKQRSDYYLESREIVNDAGKYNFMAPVPLPAKVFQDISRTYTKSNSSEMNIGGVVAEHLLYCSNVPGKTVVMWYRPAMRRSLNFSQALNIKGSADVNIPATLYLVINSTLYIYALMTNGRPEGSTKLYNAPFFNIYTDGNVCLGTAKIGKQKGKTFADESHRFERAFFMAEQNGGTSINACKTPLPELWRSTIKKKSAFPSKQELKQHPKYSTLRILTQKLIERS